MLVYSIPQERERYIYPTFVDGVNIRAGSKQISGLQTELKIISHKTFDDREHKNTQTDSHSRVEM